MKRPPLVFVLWLAGLSPAFGADPFAQASIAEKGRIVPGQQVHVSIDVFAPNFFTSAPQFPLFDLPDTVVTIPDERALNLVQTIDGVQYSGIRRAYVIVPETAGTFTLPQVAITFDYSVDGKTVKGIAHLPPARFTVVELPGGNGARLPFAARNLALTQSFDRDPAKLKAGEALVRTITVFGKDTQAMMIPAIDTGQTAGLKAYEKPPEIADNVENADGDTGSSRIQVITYIAGEAGTYTIPAISLGWFDLDAQAAKTETIPATALTVSSAPAQTQAIAPQLQAEDSKPVQPVLTRTVIALATGALCLFAALVWLARRVWPPLSARLSAWRTLRRTSETARFKELAAAIRSDDAQTVYRRLEIWSRRAGFRSIADWTSLRHDAHLSREIEALERKLFGGATDSTTFDRATLLAAVKRARFNPADPIGKRSASSLPPLNPAGATRAV